jgi:hypothetical protein
MVAARDKLTTKFSGSVFYHVLESEDVSASEEVQDRNFRDLRQHISASYYVHVIFDLFSFVHHPERFVHFNNAWYMPEVDNAEEETMLGVFPPDYYIEPNLFLYDIEDILQGKHLCFNREVVRQQFENFMSENEAEKYFHSYFVSSES